LIAAVKTLWLPKLSVEALLIVHDKPVDGVDISAVLSLLQPLGQSKLETASRLRGRIEAVLDAAEAHGRVWRLHYKTVRTYGSVPVIEAAMI
jgi:hypothetical protein